MRARSQPAGGEVGATHSKMLEGAAREGLRSATVPWNSLTGQGRGRPRKESSEPSRQSGCVWPQLDGPCRARRTPGLALCPRHAEVLSQPSHRCLWPGCIQSSYGSCCGYHSKVVHLLIDAPRNRSEAL